MYELTTAVDVDAPPERVWATLLDFDAYPDWNPLLRVRGRPNLGARLEVQYITGGRTVRFRPTVTVCDRRRELRWQSHRYVRGLFDGEHRFSVEPVGDDRTRFVQAESFTGVLAPPLFRLVRDSTRSDFEAMNAALKRHVEAGPSADDHPESPDAGPDSTGDAPGPSSTGDAPGPNSTGDAPGPDSADDAPGPDSADDAPGPDSADDAPGPDSTDDAPGPTDDGPDSFGGDLDSAA